MGFEGVHWRQLEALAPPKPNARFAIAHAEQGFTANVPIEFLRDEHALLATHANGEPLSAEHGWPLRLVIPGKYFWKSAKWLRGIELCAEDVPGFWERYGYAVRIARRPKLGDERRRGAGLAEARPALSLVVARELRRG